MPFPHSSVREHFAAGILKVLAGFATLVIVRLPFWQSRGIDWKSGQCQNDTQSMDRQSRNNRGILAQWIPKCRNIMPRPHSKLKTYLYRLFTENEQLRQDDATLMTLIRKHFPNSQLDKAVGRHKNRLGIWRSEYNRGLLVGQKPSVLSVAYYDRKPVGPTGRQLTEKEQLVLRNKYGIQTISLKAVRNGVATIQVESTGPVSISIQRDQADGDIG